MKKLQIVFLLNVVLTLILVPLFATKISASTQIAEFPTPTPGARPQSIIMGPDGALWFTEKDSSKIGRSTTSGQITEFAVPTNSNLQTITNGPDGALWFTEPDARQIGRISTTGSIIEYSAPTSNNSGPWDIVTGSDGALWFSQGSNKIGRMTTSGDITEYTPLGVDVIYGITLGPDDAVWFADYKGNVGKITPSGNITVYPIPLPEGEAFHSIIDITAGSDGALWFTDQGLNRLYRITTSGAISDYYVDSIPQPSGLSARSLPTYITSGPDGALWYTENNTQDGYNHISRFDVTTKQSTRYKIPTLSSYPGGITSGPDGTIWFTEGQASKIARLSIPPQQPLNLHATTPTNQPPVLSWNPVSGAITYGVYRNGTNIANITNTTFTDNTVPSDGSYLYHVTATGLYGSESLDSNKVTIVYDTTAPAVSNVTISPVLLRGPTTVIITADASDTLSGVFVGEYYVDNDPGQGNGQPLYYSNGKITTTSTLGTGLTNGAHLLYVRAKDRSGNWSTTAFTVFIYLNL